MKWIVIQQCSDPSKWYANQVGMMVRYIGESDTEYEALEEEGYTNYIDKDDGFLITEEVSNTLDRITSYDAV